MKRLVQILVCIHAHTNASKDMLHFFFLRFHMQVCKLRAYQSIPQQNGFIKKNLILLLSA